MSGVEDGIDPHPEKCDGKEDRIEEKEEEKSILTTSVSDSDSASLTESWTLLEKEEDNAVKVMIKQQWLIMMRNHIQKDVSPMENDVAIIGSSVEDIPDKTQGDSFKSLGMLE